MRQRYTGVRVVESFPELKKLYEDGFVELKDKEGFFPNQYLVLKSDSQASALAKVSSDFSRILLLRDQNPNFFDIRPKNKEQVMLFDLLNDEKIQVVTVTGKAGTGKSLIIGAYLTELITGGFVDKVVISKPMEIVGTSKYFGTVPGDENQKFSPFLINFKYLFDKLTGEKGRSYFDMMQSKGAIEFMPLELMRGVSFGERTIVYLDEAQNIDDHVMKTLGTRVGEGCRLIITGDYNQVDVKTKGFQPGLLKVIENDFFQKSPITGHIHLLKVERGPVAELFTRIFEEE
jgi:PhoH-like ATPase